MTVSLISLNSSLLDKFSEEVEVVCNKLSLPCKIMKHVVKKRELDSLEINDNSDLTVILHKNEGRLLLTDKNGIYDTFLRKQFAEKGSSS